MGGLRRRGKKDREHDVFDLLEEAFHALRVSPLSTLAIFYFGSVPFVIALFYFWADMSRSSFALQDAGLASLVVGGAYFWMKVWQSVFCQKMWMQLNATGESVERSRGETLRYLSAQALIQSTAIPALILAMICLIPLVWVYAFYQNVSVLGLTQNYGHKPLRNLISDAARQSHWAWEKNHALAVVLAVFSLFVWMSVVMMAVALPYLAKMLLGIESVFTMNPVATLLNSTFVLGTFLVVFLCVSPLTKTLYVIRCFYGQSRKTGDDLLSRLAGLRSEWEQRRNKGQGRGSNLGRVAAFLLVLSFSTNGMTQTSGEQRDQSVSETEVARKSGMSTAEDFDVAIQSTLQEKHFQWRLSREKVVDENEGGIMGFFRDLVASLVVIILLAVEMVKTLLKRLFGGDEVENKIGDFESWQGLGEMASVIGVVLMGIFLVSVIVKVIAARRRQTGAQEVEVAVVETIDLESESVVATQLPEDEWMRLAREKIERGEYRLAVRALFLASLSHLGEQGLLKVTRSKSNRDYRGELSLKARSMPDLIGAFNENVGLFERVWYGLHDIRRDAVDRFTRNYEQITAMSGASGKGEDAT
ncbi:MAG: DUF4129 domain-containing protein [Verrucomicrobia bacterium]|nr:DUF4129 domain-containing protein [Verrucomicrobiota bacterium]